MSEECGCGHHDITTDDITRHNHLVLNALVKVLIEKKIIESDDINKAAEELQQKIINSSK